MHFRPIVICHCISMTFWVYLVLPSLTVVIPILLHYSTLMCFWSLLTFDLGDLAKWNSLYDAVGAASAPESHDVGSLCSVVFIIIYNLHSHCLSACGYCCLGEVGQPPPQLRRHWSGVYIVRAVSALLTCPRAVLALSPIPARYAVAVLVYTRRATVQHC